VSTSISLEWLEQSPLPTLDGAAGTAERLVLLIHYGVDFNIWGGQRRVRYWDALAERVRAATYAGPTLEHWWIDICRSIVSSPRDERERLDAATLLASANSREVLEVLRSQAPALVLRARVLSDARRQARANEEVSE
jgi:hypothetical protein